METSEEPSMLAYARFYKLSEDYMLQSPISYADETCEPKPPIPPAEGLAAANPEERMKEVDRLFCTGIMMERLPAKPEHMAILQQSLQPKPVTGNVWHGLLPVLKTSDLGPEPVLRTAEDEENGVLFPTGLQPQFSTGPSVSTAPSMPGFPGPGVSGPSILEGLALDLELDRLQKSLFPNQNPPLFDNSPTTHVTVPGGPNVPAVPPSMRQVFDHYNPSPAPNVHQPPESSCKVTTAEILLPENDNPCDVNMSGEEAQYKSIESDNDPFDYLPVEIPSVLDFNEDSSLQSSQDLTQSENNLFDQATIGNFMLEEVSPDAKSQSMSNVVSPNLTKSKAPSTGTSVERLAQELRVAGDVKRKERNSSEPVLDTVRTGEEKEESVAMSEGKLNEYKPDASNVACSRSTLQAGDQILPHMATSSLDAKKSHVLPNFPREQTSETAEAHTLSAAEQWERCAAKEKAFRQRVEHHSPIIRMKKQFFEFQNVAYSVNLTQTPSTSNAAFAGLGSLSTFMQTRGTYEAGTSSQNQNMSISTSDAGRASDVPPLGNCSYMYPRPNTPPTPHPNLRLSQKVTEGANMPPPTIFLSTDLLRTHVLLVRYMEEWQSTGPNLIYRQYEQPFAQILCPSDADLIVAPDTGVILTTPFALTQRYPPGHGPTDPSIHGVTGVVSQLRERIWKLAPRYENMFVLICRPDDNADANLTRIAKSQLKYELPGLLAFCGTIRNIASVELVPISHHPATIMMWCFGLGRMYCPYSSLFPAIRAQETEPERILRKAGLNPFAARVILDDIHAASVEDSNVDPQDLFHGNTGDDAEALDAFLSHLDTVETRGRYEHRTGARVFARFRANVDSMTRSTSSGEENEEDVHGIQMEFD